ncbi:hypothetical protein ABIE13_005328, partial [Ottowia thiooxydans]
AGGRLVLLGLACVHEYTALATPSLAPPGLATRGGLIDDTP